MPSKKRRKKLPYTSLTLEWLKRAGYHADKESIVERRIPNFRVPWMSTTKDFCGAIDVIALSLNRGIPETIGVQSTSAGQLKPHVTKCLAERRVRYWLWNKNRFWIVAWRKVLEGKRERWRPRIVELSLVQREGKRERVVSKELTGLPGQHA